MFQNKNEETVKSARETAKAAGAEEKVSESVGGQTKNPQADEGERSKAEANKAGSDKAGADSVEANSAEAGGAEAGGAEANRPEANREAANGKPEDAKADEPEPGDKKSSGRKDPKDEKIEELQDRLKRQMAEFDNYRKRTEKEKSAMYEVGARDIIEKILPVLDNFERGLAAVPEDVKESSFAEGVTMIYKQFVKTLEDAGVETIEAKGKTFDPNLHNAVMHIEDEAYGENEISQELQKGYKYRGTVVRHSMVQVAN